MKNVATQLVAGCLIVVLFASGASAQVIGYPQPVQGGGWPGSFNGGTFGQPNGYPGPVNFPQPMPMPLGPGGPAVPGGAPNMSINWTGGVLGTPYQLNVQPGGASLTWTGVFSGRGYRIDFSR